MNILPYQTIIIILFHRQHSMKIFFKTTVCILYTYMKLYIYIYIYGIVVNKTKNILFSFLVQKKKKKEKTNPTEKIDLFPTQITCLMQKLAKAI